MNFQQAIDAKLTPLLHEVRRLREERNTYAFISKLPDELLLNIFMVLMALSPVERWHQIAHVCRWWRNVAVGASTLWTKPSTAKHRLTMLMLERSKTAGLTIRMDYDTRSQTATEILKHIGRIESLAIVERDEGYEDDDEVSGDLGRLSELVRGLVQEATRLQVLEICSRDSIEIIRHLRPSSQLQRLLLSNATFDWAVLPLCNLAHLSFTHVSLSTPISIQQLINTLRQMPLMESLALRFSHTLRPLSLSGLTEPKVILPSLRLLSLRDSHPDDLHYFLSHTEIPRLRRLDLGIQDPHEYISFIDSYYSKIISVIASAVINGDFGIFEAISMNSWLYTTFMLGAKDDFSYCIHAFEQLPESPCMSLNLACGWSWDESPMVFYRRIQSDLFELCRANFSRVLHLNILYDSITTEAEFVEFLGGPLRSSLQTITIHGITTDRIPTLTNVFTVPPHPVGELPTIPFPDLRSLTCAWAPQRSYAAPQPSTGSELDDFCQCLMYRRECGYPLHKLDLQDFSPSISQVTLLREAVDVMKIRG